MVTKHKEQPGDQLTDRQYDINTKLANKRNTFERLSWTDTTSTILSDVDIDPKYVFFRLSYTLINRAALTRHMSQTQLKSPWLIDFRNSGFRHVASFVTCDLPS